MKKLPPFILSAALAGVAAILTTGIASADNVFVVNNGGSSVSEISGGVVTPFITSDLNSPTGIAIASDGDFFVANNAGYVEEFSPTGAAIEQYSTGENNPRGITFDSAGNLYVAEQGNHDILEIPVGGGPGTVVASGFSAINDLAFDNGTLYVTDGGAGSIDAVSGGSITQLVTGLSSPNGLAFDNAGHVFVVQHNSSTISEYTTTGTVVDSSFITETGAQGPKTLAIDSAGDFYITDNGDNTVTEYNAAGDLLATFSSSTFNGPCFVATDIAVPEPSTYALLLARRSPAALYSVTVLSPLSVM